MNLRDKFLEVLHNKPQINIGKKGIDSGVLDHILKTLKKDKIIKIHALKSALVDNSIKALAEYVKTSTNSFLLDVRGHTFVISKRYIDIKEIKNKKKS